LSDAGTQLISAISRINRATVDSVVSIQAEQDRAIQDAVLTALDWLRANHGLDYAVLSGAYQHATGDMNQVPIRSKINAMRGRFSNRKANSSRVLRAVQQIETAMEEISK
jgi:hypothetical protein